MPISHFPPSARCFQAEHTTGVTSNHGDNLPTLATVPEQFEVPLAGGKQEFATCTAGEQSVELSQLPAGSYLERQNQPDEASVTAERLELVTGARAAGCPDLTPASAQAIPAPSSVQILPSLGALMQAREHHTLRSPRRWSP